MSTKSWGDFSKSLIASASERRLPLSGAFELTPRCNFKCKMCYVRLDAGQIAGIGREKTADEWIALGRQAAEAGTLNILLTGGEPFLRPDFRRIYEALGRMGFLLKIYTNASLITEDTVEWLVKAPPVLIRATLYGASNETYEKVCGDPKGFDKAINGIELLQNAGMSLALSSTIITENESDITAMKAFADDRKIPFIYTYNVVSSVRGAKSSASSSRLSDNNYAECVLDDYAGGRAPDAPPYISPLSRCNNVRCAFFVTWDGKLTFCSFMNDHYAYPFENGFSYAWSELESLIGNIQSPAECLECKYNAYCTACVGALSAETGRCDRTSARLCNAAKLLYESNTV